MPIVASSLLRIKEVEISFDADLIGLTEEENEKAQTKDNEGGNQTDRGSTEKKKSVLVQSQGEVKAAE